MRGSNPIITMTTASGQLVIQIILFIGFEAVFTLTYRSKNTVNCDQEIYGTAGKKATILSPGFPEKFAENSKCATIIHAPEGYRIRIIFERFNIPISHDCHESYLRIGNDQYRMNLPGRTSYLFCGKTLPYQIVSRGNYIWLVLKTSRAVFQKQTYGFQASYDIMPSVNCDNASLYRCSDVECVSRDKVCDGRRDCTNNLDEYCGHLEDPIHPCFLCQDHKKTCITPTIPKYSLDWGKPYWWLCDGYEHCPDGSDERPDVCFVLSGRSRALFKCYIPVAKNIKRKGKAKVFILRKQMCDGIKDCLNGEDEEEDYCKSQGGSTVKIEIICVPVVAVLLIIIIVAFIYRKGRKKNRGQHERLGKPATAVDVAEYTDDVQPAATPTFQQTSV